MGMPVCHGKLFFSSNPYMIKCRTSNVYIYIYKKQVYVYMCINICLPTFGLNLRYMKVNVFLHGAAYDMGIQTRRLFKMY